MELALERIAGERIPVMDSDKGISPRGSTAQSAAYSTFAEMYLEKPANVLYGISCTLCTWRGVPTIDDW